jgi:hypothetical protein
MKKNLTLSALLALVLLPAAALAQDAPVTIVGDLADGTPPPPAPEVVLPEVEIRETFEHQLGNRKITINRIKDPGLPDPRPVPLKDKELTPEEIEAFRNSPEVQQWLDQAAKTTHMFISATVIDHRATLIRWWHDGTEYRAWSNANWLYLTGFTECQKGDRHFSSLLLASNMNSALLPEDSPYRIPGDLPTVPGTYRVIQGALSNAAAFEGITAFHELYQSDFARLKEAYELREQRRREQEAELLANPPKPKDIVLHYWKVEPKKETPARPMGGGR